MKTSRPTEFLCLTDSLCYPLFIVQKTDDSYTLSWGINEKSYPKMWIISKGH